MGSLSTNLTSSEAAPKLTRSLVVWVAAVNQALSLHAVLTNTAIILAAWGLRKTQGVGFGVGLLALGDLILGLGMGLGNAATLSGAWEGMSRGACLRLSAAALFAIYASSGWMLGLGLDRFFAIRFPAIYNLRAKGRYRWGLGLPSVGLGLVGVLVAEGSADFATPSAGCFPAASISGAGQAMFLSVTNALMLSCVVVYGRLFAVVRRMMRHCRRLERGRIGPGTAA